MNFIGDTGARLLSESLKSNTTLIELNLESEGHKKDIKGIHQQITSFIFTLLDGMISDEIEEVISCALQRNQDEKRKRRSDSDSE